MGLISTVEILPDADNTLMQIFPTWNNGASVFNTVGSDTTGYARHALMRFKIPQFTGRIKEAHLRLYIHQFADKEIAFMIVDSPQDDIWIEGNSSMTTDPEGSTWNEYAKDFPWAAAGGDFGDMPIAIKIFSASDPTGWYNIDLPLDNITFSAGKTISLIAIPAETLAVSNEFISWGSKERVSPDWRPRLILTLDEGLEEYD